MILIKEEFIGGEKFRRAGKLGGSDAIVMWLAMKCYCAMHPSTEGFVPDEDLDGLPGAPRRARPALQALLGCGGLLPGGARGAGLVEAAQGGWQLHDYLDHSAPPEDLELSRARARARKQIYREQKRRELAALLSSEAKALGPSRDCPALSPGHLGDTAGDSAGHLDGTARDIQGDKTRDGPPGAPPPEGAGARAPTRGHARSQPNPTQPNLKTLSALTSKIRDPRGRARGPAVLGDLLGVAPQAEAPPTVVASLEPCEAHRQFAAEHGVDLERIVADVRTAPGGAALTPDDARARIAGRLMSATTEQRQGVEGAA